MSESQRTSRLLPLLTFGLGLISLACFVIPLYVIRPFRHQGATELTVALFVKQIGPLVSTCCALLALLLVVVGWRRARGRIWRSMAVCSVLLAIAGVYLARLNVYELMFHPLGAPQFLSIGQAHMDKDDMLIAVKVNGVARGYPIREMAYHHVVNDMVGGEAIVATY